MTGTEQAGDRGEGCGRGVCCPEEAWQGVWVPEEGEDCCDLAYFFRDSEEPGQSRVAVGEGSAGNSAK